MPMDASVLVRAVESGKVQAPTYARRPDGGRRGVADASRTKARNYRCACCGHRASVHVLEGYERGQPVVRRFCLACADRAAPWSGSQVGVGLRPGLPALAGWAGFILMMVGLFGDFLVPDRHAGFGLYQQTGVLLALLLVFLGALLRVGPLALGGVFLLVASVGADWFGLISGVGVGWKQQTLVAVGAILTLGGLGGWLRGRRRFRLGMRQLQDELGVRHALSGSGVS